MVRTHNNINLYVRSILNYYLRICKIFFELERSIRRCHVIYTHERNLHSNGDEALHVASEDPCTHSDFFKDAERFLDSYGSRVSVLYFDVDNLRALNYVYGHRFGDEVICAMKARLLNLEKPNSLFAHIESDELVVLIANEPEKEVLRFANLAIEHLSAPIAVNELKVHVTVSVGIAHCPTSGRDVQTLIWSAYTALTSAKSAGKNQSFIHCPELSTMVREKIQIQSAILDALETDEFYLVYQPRIDTSSGQISCVEALLRWNSKQFGPLFPNDFIPFAEESNVIQRLGDWVLKRVVYQIKEWIQAGIPAVRVGINVSAKQICDEDYAEHVTAVLNELGVEAKYLEIEITETALSENERESIKTLTTLQSAGIKVSIDDFGMGYSSLGRLIHFPVDTLKIDKAFVQDIHGKGGIVAESIITLSKNIGISVVAEGVETAEQADFLSSRECHEMQGFLYARPLTESQLRNLLMSEYTYS